MRHEPGQARLLTGHFLRRLLENDLLSAGEDWHAPVAAILAAIVSTAGGIAAILLMKYNPPRPLPLSEKLAMAVDDKVLLLGCAMIVMALLTLLVWEALALDPRDVAILGPLPIRARTLLLAKTASVAGLALAFAVALSLPPAVLFPAVMLAYAPVGLGYAIWSMGAQAVACFLACAFVFLTLVSLRSLASLTLPAALARRALLGLQCVLIPALFTALLLMPLLATLTRPAIEAGSPAVFACPPLWFLGVNDAIVGRGDPLLRELATSGVAAVAAATVLACAAYLLAFRRDLLRFRSRATASRGGGVGQVLVRLVMRLLVADPLARATFAFTVSTLARSAQHRLYLVGSLGAGLALACVSVAGAHGRVDAAMLHLAPATLAVQFHLLFFLLVGVRLAAGLPADLPAAWLFRFRASEAMSRYLAGTRSAVFAFGVLPLLLLLAPAHALLWGWHAAAVHFAWGLGHALALWALLFRRCERLPFTCTAAPGRARLSNRLWLYVGWYLVAVHLPAVLERNLTGNPELAVAWLMVAAAGASRLVVRRPSHVSSDRMPAFDPGGRRHPATRAVGVVSPRQASAECKVQNAGRSWLNAECGMQGVACRMQGGFAQKAECGMQGVSRRRQSDTGTGEREIRRPISRRSLPTWRPSTIFAASPSCTSGRAAGSSWPTRRRRGTSWRSTRTGRPWRACARPSRPRACRTG